MVLLIKKWFLCCLIPLSAIGQISVKNRPLKGSDYQSSVRPDIIFDHLTEKDGLSNENVTDMLRDKDGFLWVATNFGLNRYDGQRFEIFKHNRKDSTSILNNAISAICEDSKGNIWGTTEDGIFCYQKATGRFRNYRSQDKSLYPKLNDILIDKRGNIWAAGEYGFVKLDPVSGVFKYYKHHVENTCSISYFRIGTNGLALDPGGKGIWIGTAVGINFFDFENEDFTNFRNNSDSTVFNAHRINVLYMGHKGILWMLNESTSEIIGINTLNRKVIHRINISNYIKNPYQGNIFETSIGELWYSSKYFETIRIDLINNYQISIVKNNVADINSIIGDYISSGWEDTDHTIWLGTSAGIARYNPNRLFYRIIRLSDTYPTLDNTWNITFITENPTDGTWWIGSRSGKIYIYDPVSMVSSVLDVTKMANGQLVYGFIVDIEFHDGLALICFINEPALQYDLKNKTLSKFSALQGKHENYNVRLIVHETDSTYILGNNFYPLLRWNFRKNTLKEINFHKPMDPDGLEYSARWLNGMKDKGTWMSAQNSSAGYIHPGDSLIYTVDMKIGVKIGEGGYFNSLGTDIHGNVFFTYISKGAYQIKKCVDKIESIDDVELQFWDSSNGLISENLQSSVSDYDGNIWLAAHNKFSVLNPVSNSIFSFKINLSENNNFYYNYFTPLQNGHMLTNIKGNLVEFFPERMNTAYPANNPLISSIKVQDKIQYISGDSEVSLNPDENFISVRFGCLSIDEYSPYFFQYKMDGINTDWVKSGTATEAVYSNLPSGKYLFRLRTVSADNVWQSEEKRLSIIIKTPFYKSWWFLLLLALIMGSFVFYSVQQRLNTIRNINMLKTKTQLLEKEKTAVMYENLKQHLNPHFLFNSLTSLSSLIRLDPKQAGDFLDKMSKVYRYILRNKENETVPLIEELKFVEMYNQLQKTRFGDGLIIRIEIPEEYHYRKIAPVTLQNLVENAIKHNIADEESPLIIRMYIEDDFLIVSNNLQRKNFVETSNKQGQNSMVSLYRFLSPRAVKIGETETDYTVHIPLI